MIDLSNVTAIALGSDDVLKIQDAIGTVLWQKTIYYTVNISAGSNGTVSVNGVSGNYSQSVPSGTVLTIEGTGNTGYNFDEWSDGNTTNPRTITVNSDITLTAAFEAVVLPNYFYVEDVSGSANTLSITKKNANAPTITVYKSSNQQTWTSMGSTSTTAITATIPANGKLYLKATTSTWCTDTDAYNSNEINCSGNFNVGGNIMSLLYGDNFENQTTFSTTYTFTRLFYGKNTLISAANLVLPATTLTDNCYQVMFCKCTALTTAPALPATTLAEDCYNSMFKGCTSLSTTPTISATTLANYCCYRMFLDCTALTTASALPATTLAQSCYVDMFSNCTALTTAPVLPATTLAPSCYYTMFFGCSALRTAPTLPATTLANLCYDGMFSRCTSLTTAPALPATTLARECYQGMFYGCTRLTTPPALPATTLDYACYNDMFYGCTRLTTPPILPATTLTEWCYRQMFYGCTNLNQVTTYANDISASGCLEEWLTNVAAAGDFYNLGSASYTSGASGIPSGWTVHTSL